MVVEMLQFVPFVKKVVIALMDISKNVQITKPVRLVRAVVLGASLALVVYQAKKNLVM